MLGVLGLGSCGSDVVDPRAVTTEPPGPPYLAIVPLVETDVPAGLVLNYRIAEISGRLGVDTLVEALPHDTVIASVPAATYAIELQGLPPTCDVAEGTVQSAIIPPGTNTYILRYRIGCDPSLFVSIETTGSSQDTEYLYLLTGPSGERVGALAPTDTLRFDRLPGGLYTMELAGVAPNCEVISPGGRIQVIDIPDRGAASLSFRINCGDPLRRPGVDRLRATFADGVVVMAARVSDAQGDISGYVWDVTDCRNASILGRGGSQRSGLEAGRTAGATSTTIFATFDMGVLKATDLRGRCALLRLFDREGNASKSATIELQESVPSWRTNAGVFRFVAGTQYLVSLELRDAPPYPFAGHFPTLRLRDGLLSPTDGIDDVGVLSAAGFTDELEYPGVSLAGRLQRADILGIEVYLIDMDANFQVVRGDP